MIKNSINALCIVFSFFWFSNAVLGQQVEIYIPGSTDETPETFETENLLARCLATGMEEYCSGVSLSKDGVALESNGPSDIVLETFIIDLSDNQNTPKPKVTVKPDAGTQDIKDKTTSSQSVTSIGIEIQFDFNSNKIRTDQFEKMSRLAAALADEINAGARFAVIGHTDGKGSDAYNCRLSEKRAASVTTRLLLNGAQNHLRSVGAGEALLKTTVAPDSAKNRRVSFLKLGENEVATLNAFQSLCN